MDGNTDRPGGRLAGIYADISPEKARKESRPLKDSHESIVHAAQANRNVWFGWRPSWWGGGDIENRVLYTTLVPPEAIYDEYIPSLCWIGASQILLFSSLCLRTDARVLAILTSLQGGGGNKVCGNIE